MRRIQASSFRLIHNNWNLQTFSTASIRANSSQNPNPIRIPFQSENLYHLKDAFSLKCDRDTLKGTHKQFLEYLTKNSHKGKPSFQNFSNSNKNLYDYIRTGILQEQDLQSTDQFIKRSHYYFSTQGKKIRPTMVKIIADCFTQNTPENAQKIQKWGALIEMMHISSLAHDDIIDDSPSRRGMQSQHLKYGKKSAVYSANYIIAKASKTIHDFNSPKLYQIYSVAMDNLATGQIIQAVSKNNTKKNIDLKQEIQTYVHKTYFKTAALMANALLGVPVFFESATHQQQLACFRVGQHLGLAFQLVDDIIDYTSTTELMGKQCLADIAEGNVTGPVYFSLLSEARTGRSPTYQFKQLKSKKKSKDQALKIKEWVFANNGIELTYALADMHIKRALQFLQIFPNSNIQAWKYLGYKILSRNK